MKEELTIKIRSNILNEILSRISQKEQYEFDEIVEDSLISYFKIRLNDIESPMTQNDDIIILDDINHGYYVYAFMDPTIKKKTKIGIEDLSLDYEPFYIGKGIGRRADDPFRNEIVNLRISYLKSKGLDPIIIKIKEDISNLSACKLENYLINKLGRSDIGKGPLLNLSGGISFSNIENLELEYTELNLEKNTNLLILDALNKSKRIIDAAKMLGVSERTVFRKIKELDIIFENNKYSFKKKAD